MQITSTRLIPFRSDIVIRPRHPRINSRSQRRLALRQSIILKQPIGLTAAEHIILNPLPPDPPT